MSQLGVHDPAGLDQEGGHLAQGAVGDLRGGRLDDQGAVEPLGLDLVEQLGDASVLAVAPGLEADQPERVVLDLPIVDIAALAGR